MELFIFPQAGAACCQLEDDNSLYLRMIGVANRHRYSKTYWVLLQDGYAHEQQRLLYFSSDI
jgi:hypothetical protein